MFCQWKISLAQHIAMQWISEELFQLSKYSSTSTCLGFPAALLGCSCLLLPSCSPTGAGTLTALLRQGCQCKGAWRKRAFAARHRLWAAMDLDGCLTISATAGGSTSIGWYEIISRKLLLFFQGRHSGQFHKGFCGRADTEASAWPRYRELCWVTWCARAAGFLHSVSEHRCVLTKLQHEGHLSLEIK